MKNFKNNAALLLFILLTLCPIDVSAQTNHSLEWGVEIGDEIEYFVERSQFDESIMGFFNNSEGEGPTGQMPFPVGLEEGQKVIAQVASLEPIPPVIENSTQWPSANCTVFRANDSQIVMENMSMVIVPIGDWELSSEMMNFSFSEDVRRIDTEEKWGQIIDSEFSFAIFAIHFYWEMIYFKVNGTLSSLAIQVSMSGTSMIDMSFIKWNSSIVTTTDTLFQNAMSFAIVTVSAVVIFLGALVIFDRRSK